MGYARGWAGQNIRRAFWRCQTLAGNIFIHEVTGIASLTPGYSYEFKIERTGEDAWGCYIGGLAATDSSGDNVANSCLGANTDWYHAGIRCNAGSSKLGSSGNWVDFAAMQKKMNDGSWSYATQGIGYDLTGDPQSRLHGHWITQSRSSEAYRNW